MTFAEQMAYDMMVYGMAFARRTPQGAERIDPSRVALRVIDDRPWVGEARSVLEDVLEERKRQVERYGHNEECPEGTGPEVRWLQRTDVNLDLRTATEIEAAFRSEYERHPVPTRMHLVREEIAEAFKEPPGSPELEAELIQVAALCTAWVEHIRRQRRG